MTRRRNLLLVVGLCLLPSLANAADPASLQKWISLRFRGTEWVSTSRLDSWLKGPETDQPLLLDVRSAEEFQTSHLAGALRIDPESREFDLGAVPAGRRIVTYCSVGYRSAAVARRLSKLGFEHVYNLGGGIFAWANEGRPVYQGATQVGVVHPFGERWGRYLAPGLHPPEAPTDGSE